MSKNYVIGFPRIGEQRELKRSLEDYWANKISYGQLQQSAKELRKRHWNIQQKAGVKFISSNDFSLYDNILDMSVMFGAIPKRFRNLQDEKQYFTMARGDDLRIAMQMTKWFNTNYHYIVPELSKEDNYILNPEKIINEYNEAKELGIQTKINIIGPLTYLGLSKRVDGGDVYELYDKFFSLYIELLETIATLDDTIYVQFDEPIFAKDLPTQVLSLIKPTYDRLSHVSQNIKISVVSYFEHSTEASDILVHTPIWAIGLDFLYGSANFDSLKNIAKSGKTLLAGVVDGRNIWKNDIKSTLKTLNKISCIVEKGNIIPATSCSLLHTPFSLQYETKMDAEIKSWLSFAHEKLEELSLVSKLFQEEKLNTKEEKLFLQNKTANKSRKNSSKIHDQTVQSRIKNLTNFQREGLFEERMILQRECLGYEELPTTTIGSFPQTPEVRKARADYKKGLIERGAYEKIMKEYIDHCIALQVECGLDVLVHGEPERNDMVEYFGEQLNGYGFTQNGWVQSYGSRCVKPPFIYGDISRAKPMTIDWISYAQSKTDKIVKGMLTGPVTILNWSFVRDDITRDEVSKQIAVALSEEVDDLQKAGTKIIQVDEAAFKEGYPLRKENIKTYEKWAVRDFKIAVSSANPTTQIHTHMCYSEFNDIIQTIEDMDADVISIETARSGNRLLKIFRESGYKQEVGPGVYDIHSPRVPSVNEMVTQIELLMDVLPKEQLWINPDCGLKTRKYDEVIPSLKNMVEAVQIVKQNRKAKTVSPS